MMKHKHAELIHAWAGGAKIQYKSRLCNIWIDTKYPSWDVDLEYRIKPEKPSIDWNQVNRKYNYLVVDGNGTPLLCSNKPDFCESFGEWVNADDCLDARVFASFRYGKCEAKDSLVERPQ